MYFKSNNIALTNSKYRGIIYINVKNAIHSTVPITNRKRVRELKSKSTVLLWMLYDVVALTVSLILSVLVAVNFHMSGWTAIMKNITIFSYMVASCVIPNVVFLYLTKEYKVIWKYASPVDYCFVAAAPIVSSLLLIILGLVFHVSGLHYLHLPKNVYVINLVLSETVIAGPRVFFRLYAKLYGRKTYASVEKTKRIMIIGAGEAAQVLINDISSNKGFAKSEVVCAIDDDETKTGKYINGIRIAGTRHDIVTCAKKYAIDRIIFAVPSMDKNERRVILEICSQTGCELKTMPSIDDAVNNPGKLSVSDVKIEDLLERVPIKLHMREKMSYVTGKVVMVTGGGGSIGSELCRQIVRYNPKLLIIFDVYENNAYDIQNELKANYPEANVLALIGSVRDSRRMENIFEKYRPEIVYHAAAHKHVPLMEDSPNEAIKNNVFGTYKTAEMADKYGTSRFVLISTDKAVNPTNVMGASKRMCEMVVQNFSRRSKTEFVAVRFGNVLGSNGSVIPLFKKQIEAGGPVKVTHPDIIRYFMTIPEAVSLVLTAGAMAKGGEIFVLDMGKPVKILDLAKNMIRLMGYKVDEDIKIEFTGLRPGEKLYEELLMGEEGLENTENDLIHVGKPIEFDDDWFIERLENLKDVMYDDSCDIRTLIHEIVPTYKMPQ